MGKLIGAIGALGVEIIKQAGGATLISVLADVAGLSCLVNVAALIKLHDLLAGAQRLISVEHIGENLLRGFTGELLGLRDDETRARDFTLVAVEDGELDVEEKRAGVGGGDVRIVEGDSEVALAIGFGEQFGAARSGKIFLRGLQVGAGAQRQRFQIVDARAHWLIIEFTFDIVIVGSGFISEELTQACQRLHFAEFRGKKVVLELQHLQLNLEQVALAHGPGFIAQLAEVDGLLETVEILLRKIDGGLGENRGDKLLRNVEDELALIIGHRRARCRGQILRGLQAMLAFLANLEGVAQPHVELRLIIDVVVAELTGIEERQELGVPGKDRVGVKICSCFEGLVLQDGRARGLQGVIVLQSQANRLLNGNSHSRGLRCRCPRWRSCLWRGVLLCRRESG